MTLLEDLKVYQLAMEIGEAVYSLVLKWDIFNKKNLGDQFTRAADSVALNIAEGYAATITKKTGISAGMPLAPCLKQNQPVQKL